MPHVERSAREPYLQELHRGSGRAGEPAVALTYGIAAVAALGTDGAIRAGWMFVALPIPAWILLAYNAILWNKVATHTTAAKAYKAALETIAGTAVADTVPTRDEWKPWARGVFGIVGSRLLSCHTVTART